MHDPSPFTNPHKARTGLSRLWHAGGYSLAGLRAGWHEKAFRQEVALLAGSWLLVMVVELLNTGIEAAIDRIGPEWHALSKRAKDMGSAAVLLALLLAGGIWSAALWHRFFP